MNSQQLFARSLLRNMLQSQTRNGSHYKKVHPIATMNDMPKPEGDFFILHAARQRKNNMILAAGIILFGSAVITVKESGLINFNYSPPESLE